ncbi:choice-of-anchor G family protein, partial [Microbacterium sp. A1-JK]|uniref:choice-of-anchor G family protein n=1 Tax=Microbacterium sp. A1-JK TaxID=3177516 RepID=UPI00388DA734
MVGVSALAVFGGATAAQAAPGDSSNASGTFLGGSILDLIDLDALVNLEGAQASNDGTPPEVVDVNTLDLGALGVVNVTAEGGIQIPISFADAGVLGQYASADSDGSSYGSSGAVGSDGVVGAGPVPGSPPGPLTLDLTAAAGALGLPPALVNDVADVDLSVGVVSAQAELVGATGVTRDYTIADTTLTLQSNTVSGLAGTVNSAITPVQTTVDGLQATINDLVNGVAGFALSSDLTVDTASLTGAVSSLLTGPITSPDYPGVVVNLSTGVISIDLEQIVDLNNLGVGQEILSGATVQYIEEAVLDAIDGTLADVTQTLVEAIRGLTVTGGVDIDLGFLGTLDALAVNTTVGALADGSTAGITLLGLPVPAPGLIGAVVGVLTAPLDAVIDSVAGVATAALQPVNDVLLEVIDLVLPGVISLTANNQSEAAGEYSITALILTVLPAVGGGVLTIDLANATVGPNAIDANPDVTITAPTPGQVFTVPDADDTADVTVTGTGADGATISVAIPGQTTQPADVVDGVWTATFPDLPVGTYTATATQDVDGSVASVSFSVAAAPDVVITAPVDGDQFSVAGPLDTTDVVVSGTGAVDSIVEVELSNGDSEPVTVGPEGTWTVTFEGLPVGAYTATATQEIDGSTDTVDFSVVEAADVQIQQPVDGAEFVVDGPGDVTDVTVSGIGAPGASIEVTIPGIGTETAEVDQDGEWEVVFEDLPVAEYTATAVQDVDDSTDSVTFEVIAAIDVTILAPVDGTSIFVDDDGDTIDVTVSGTGQPGETVTVTIPDQATPAAVTVLADGTWSVTFPNLPVGDYTATATQSDGSTDTTSFAIAPEDDVAIATPTPGQVIVVPDAGDTTDVLVSGTGQPGATITVVLDGGESLTDEVDGDGNWSVLFDDVGEGGHTAVATQDVDGSTDSVDFSIEEADDVVIEEPADGETILVDGPADMAVVEVSGIGQPGAVITLTGDIPTQTATVNEQGVWTATLPALGLGEYTVTATQDIDGSTDTVTFEIDDRADVTIIDPDDGDVILVPDAGDTTTITVTGTGNPGSTVTVTIPGLDPVDTEVGEDGTWTVDVPNVPEGEQVITATQDDGSSTTVTVSVEAADDVTITSPDPGEEFTVDGVDDTTDVVVTGTGQPGATVTVALEGTDLEEVAVVLENGTWTVTFEDVEVGDYTVVATQDVDDSEAEVDFSVAAEGAVDAIDADADGMDADGVDADGMDADGVDADGMDADGMDADGMDADGMDADGVDADADADGMDADGMDADGVDADADADGM